METATTEEGLRSRIHSIFAAKNTPAQLPRERPHFWVEPTEEQRTTRVLHIHESIHLTDDAQVQDPTAAEESWLETPHAALGGRCPQDMLTGDTTSRTALGNFIAMLEQGSFT